MNKTLQFISCAVILLMALAALPGEVVVSADTTNQFGDGSTSKTLTFEGKESNHDATLKLPAESEVLEAYLKLEGDQNGGSYLYHPAFSIGDGNRWETIWDFNGTAYGNMGEQTVFTDNGTSSSLSFGGEEEKTRTLYLPKNATITSATIDISGTKSSGTMTIPETVSENSLITSTYSGGPAIACKGANVYMAWIDTGDLDYAGTDQDIFFKRSTDNGRTWSKSILLSETTETAYAPSIAVDGDEVCVGWSEGTTPFFRMSKDGGDTWKQAVKIEGMARNNPVVACSGGYRYLVWMTTEDMVLNYQISFTRSADGEKWDKPKIISDTEDRNINAYYPWISSYGSHVYVGWYEQNNNDGTYSIMYKHSSDNGGSFPKTPTAIESGSDPMDTVKLASNENGHVYAVWLRSNSANRQYDAYYSYSTDYGGSWSVPDNIDDTDKSIWDVALSSERESGVNYVYAAWEDESQNLSFIRSTNEVTWGTSQWVTDGATYPCVSANDDGHVYVGYAMYNKTNTLGNQDIFMTVSGDRGTNWGDERIISTRFFDGNSRNPEMVVSGDEIFMVWQEEGNITGIENGIDSDIFFRHFNGNDWSDTQVISDHTEDQSSQYPHIAVDGQNIYVVWQDNAASGNEDDTDTDVYVRYSSNGGTTWNPVRLVSDDANDGESWYPRVGVSGSNGYVVWREGGNIGGSGTDTDICFRRMSGGVPQGSTTIVSDDPNDGASYRPDIAVEGSTLHVVWYDLGNLDGDGTSDYDIIYRKSTNGGTSWGSSVVVSQTTTHSYYPVISVGDYIYVVWQESAVIFSRSSTGDEGSWSAQKRISSDYPYNFDLDSIDDGIVVTYQSSSAIWITGSYDAGDNWEDPVDVSTDDSLSPDYPTVGVGDDAIHVAYQDNGNVSGNGWDYDIIHRQSVDSYPSNVELDIGNDGDIDWQRNGELNEENSPQTYSGSGFVNALQEALDAAKSFTDSYQNEISSIELRVTSDTAGLVILDNLMIEYDYSLRTRDFTSALNNYLQDHQDDQDEDGNIEIPFIVSTDSAGEIRLFDLDVRYDLHKALTITSPEDDGMYNTTIDITWMAKNFESGDQVTISYYDGNTWNVLDTVQANDESWNDWDTSAENGKWYKVKIEYDDDTNINDVTDYFMIDNYPPTTTHTFDYKGQYIDGETVWGREVDITLKRDDDFEGGDDGSGVRVTYFRVDGGDWMEYSDPFTIDTHGEHTFDYYSIDEMENVEEENSGDVHIDAYNPLVDSWVIPEVRYDTDGTISVSVQVNDEDTGIDEESTKNKFQYALGEEGQPTAHQLYRNLDNQDLSGGVYSGEITEDWANHTAEENWGTFYLYLKCIIADYVGNTNTTEVFEIVEADIFPPVVIDVGSEVDDDTDDTYFVDSEVKLWIESDEEGLTGSVSISGGMPDKSTFNEDLQADGTTYWVMWDTNGIIPKSYNIRFTLTDDMDNSNESTSLYVSIQDVLYPELSVTGIAFDQNGLQNNVADQIATTINISVYNSGTLDVVGVELKVYKDDEQPGNLIATEIVDLEARGTLIISITWTPQISSDTQTIDIIAFIEELESEGSYENNEHSEEITVRKVPDFRVNSVEIQKEGGGVITKAKEGEKIIIIAVVENIGDVQASITVSAYHSGSTRVAIDNSVTVAAGATKTVNLEWLSAAQGEHTITVRADPGNTVMEKDETNNEISTPLTVEKGSTGGGTEEDEGMPIFIPILIVIVLIGGIGGAVLFMKKSKEEEDWGDSIGDDSGWDDEPAVMAPRPGPKPAPKPMQKSMQSVKPAPQKPRPDAKPAVAAAGAVAAVKVKCPKCQTILSLKTLQRPVTVKCPKCETKLTIKE